MADVQIAVIDQQNTQIALAAPSETQVNAAVPGVQGPAGEGVPQGGTANQVLFKQSGTDYDTAWGEVTSAMIGDLEIVNADVAANAEIAVSKLADGTARQLLQTDAAGTGVEWTSNVDVPGTLDVTGATTLDSTLTVPLGSAAAPTVHFTGDTNTGIYSPGADQLALATNGTGRLFVDSSGNVQIATGALSLRSSNNSISADQTAATRLRFNVNSVNALDIQRISSSGAQLIVNQFSTGASAAGYPAFSNFNDSNTGIFFPDSSDTVGISTGGTERLRITSDGKVGVGTSTFADNNALLHVSSSNAGGTGGSIVIRNGAANTAGNAAELVFKTSSGFTAGFNSAKIAAVQTTSAETADLAFYTYGSGTGTERLRITAGGAVGIGTTTPLDRFHVNGGGTYPAYSNLVYGSSASYESTLFLNHNNAGNCIIANAFTETLTIKAGYGTNGNIVFDCRGTERAKIDKDGRLLVGTSSDSGGALLQVNGDRVRIATAKTPASASATGTAGEVCWDTNYIYVCTATNTWKRAALSTW